MAGLDHWSREPGRWTPTFTPAAYAMIPTISTPRPSPDRRFVAYSRALDGRVDLMLVPSSGGLPIQLSDEPSLQGPDARQRQAFSIAWTPDSRGVVFASRADGKLFSVPSTGGHASRIDEAAGNHHSPSVSADGTRVAYVAERGEQVDIFVAAMDGAWTRCVSQGDAYVLEPKWSPDGRCILWCEWPHYEMPWDELAIILAEADGQNPRVIAGGNRVTNNQPCWSPDSQRIAFTSDRDSGVSNLWVMDRDGTHAERLVEDTCEHEHPVWSPDGNRIAYLRNEDGDYQIWMWEDGRSRQVTRQPGMHDTIFWLDDEHLVCTFSSPVAPPDLFVIGIDGSERRQLTQSATGGVLGGDLIMPEHVSWCSADGLEIHGLLLEPRERLAGEHPMVLSIHGGPTAQTRYNWLPHVQYLAQRGWVVLEPNYRGSKGYGRAFREALYGDWGRADLQDSLAGVEMVLSRGLVDRRKVVAIGGSAGGYATLICMTKAPDVFRAGVCRYGIADLTTFTDKTWVFERHYTARLMGRPSSNSDLYSDRSPINFVENVRNPILILQGDQDIVCHPTQMDAMVDALRGARKDVEYHVYPGEGHAWRRVATHVDDAERIDGFLIRKVLNR